MADIKRTISCRNTRFTVLVFTMFTSFSVLSETKISNKSLENTKVYSVEKSTKTLYEAKATWEPDFFEMHILQGHPSQMGSLKIDSRSVTAFDESGNLQWQDQRKPSDKLCIPELFSEFIRAHADTLQRGEAIKCLGPVLKAKKLAPFEVSFEGNKNGQHVYHIGPGSIGMWFFLNTIEIHFSSNMEYLTFYSGTTPAPVGIDQTMEYLTFTGKIRDENKIALITDSPLW